MTTVSIMGLGLMGGSLGLALNKVEGYTVHGYTRSKERAQYAVDHNIVNVMHDNPADAVKNADIVILCAPILAIPEQLTSVIEHLKPGAVVTDVGSTKTDVQKACDELLAGRDAVFVGSHPIAGSEKQGIDAARQDLYNRAMVVVTPSPEARDSDVEKVTKLWADAGSRVFTMSPEEHDELLAATSHLPHLMASILVLTVGRPGLREDLRDFCGTGFLDTSRVAEGGVDIWSDIVKTNREPVLRELKVFREKLDDFIEKLEQKDFVAIEKLLEEGRSFRKSFK